MEHLEIQKYYIIQSLQPAYHWLEFDEPYMLLPVSLLLERVGSQFYKITQKLMYG